MTGSTLAAPIVAQITAIEASLLAFVVLTALATALARDVLAAVNIARRSGEEVGSREIEPTAGELQRIKDRSRRESRDDRTIDEGLARRVAAGELSVDEALATHRERDEGASTESDGAEGDTGGADAG